ncbi:MAG TPA: AzlD domain-containing protein [Solirubrobacteraceae bacterium]|nr:AzlD domain-containing protein [Solirubrobacteraceae bacterium]
MSTQLWLVVAGCAIVTALIKAFGPVALGGRELPAWTGSVIVLMAPALLAALVVTAALANGRQIAVGAQTAGVVLAGLVLARGGSVLMGVMVAVLVTAGLRAVT